MRWAHLDEDEVRRDMDDAGITTTIVSAFAAVIAGMGTAIGVLFRRTIQLSDKQAELSQDLGELRGRQDGIKELSVQVLETVHRAMQPDKPRND